MSDLAADNPGLLDIRNIVVRIDRQIAETRIFVVEHGKLAAEAARFSRDRFLAAFALVVASMGAGATLSGAGIAFCKVVGG